MSFEGNVTEAATHYQVSRNTIYAWIKSGRLQKSGGVVTGPLKLERRALDIGETLPEYASRVGLLLRRVRYLRDNGLIERGQKGYSPVTYVHSDPYMLPYWASLWPEGYKFKVVGTTYLDKPHERINRVMSLEEFRRFLRDHEGLGVHVRVKARK